MNFHASPPANPATQKPLAQSVDMHHHTTVALFHAGHGMGFQAQLLSDKGFHEHFGRSFRVPWSETTKVNRCGVLFKSLSTRNLKHSKDWNCPYTFGTGADKWDADFTKRKKIKAILDSPIVK
jgi:hypothetical protein